MVEIHELLKCSKETGRENVGLYKIPVSDKQGGCAYEVTVTSEPQHSESKASGVTERDDVYYYMGERLKLERETEDSGV